jgi:hypothetical protein
MTIGSRQELGEFCLRALGAPVHNVEVDDDQLSDAVENAIQWYQEYHFDGIERDYLKHQITSDDVTNRYIDVDEDVFGIIRVLPWYPAFADGLFDITYQLRMNDLRNLSTGTLNYFTTTMEYLSLLDILLRKEKQFRFNRRMNRLYLDINWTSDVKVGDYVIVECYRTVDPDTFTEVFNDIWLKKYSTALVKKYWGANLRKYQGLALPGGVILDGDKIHAEAVEEMKQLEDDVINRQSPMSFIMG